MQNVVNDPKPGDTQLVQSGCGPDANQPCQPAQGGPGQVYGVGGWHDVGDPSVEPLAAPVEQPVGASDNFTGGCSQ